MSVQGRDRKEEFLFANLLSQTNDTMSFKSYLPSIEPSMNGLFVGHAASLEGGFWRMCSGV